MAKSKFHSKYGIVRSAIKRDLLFFGLPAIVVFVVGLIVSGRDGYNDMVATLWNLVRQPQNLHLLSVPNIVGLVIFVIGFTVMLIAASTLKRFYSSSLVIRHNHQLITYGIYRFVRHPIYFGAIIAICVGVPVYASSLYGLLTLSALIPIILNRIRMEERLLTEEFGDAYRTYQKTTSKLIPFIY